MGVAIQRPERRIGSLWAGLWERAPFFACQIPLKRLIKDQQANPIIILSLKNRQKSAASRGANLEPDKESNRQFFQFSSLKTRAHYGDKPFCYFLGSKSKKQPCAESNRLNFSRISGKCSGKIYTI
ncbi:MAG: hypothetical protein ACKV1O_01535 [Saprospiraceae bacterium]